MVGWIRHDHCKVEFSQLQKMVFGVIKNKKFL